MNSTLAGNGFNKESFAKLNLGMLMTQMGGSMKTESADNGFGGMEMIQFYTEKGILFTIAGDGGNLPFHTIMMIESNGNIAMAGLKLKKAVEQLAKVI